MFSNCRSSNLTRKNLLNNVGSLTWYKPFSYDTTNSESRRTSRERTPCEMVSRRSSIRHYIQQHCWKMAVDIHLLKTVHDP